MSFVTTNICMHARPARTYPHDLCTRLGLSLLLQQCEVEHLLSVFTEEGEADIVWPAGHLWL